MYCLLLNCRIAIYIGGNMLYRAVMYDAFPAP